ncbi:MAG: helix-turn-helix domain-containing protein [Kiritimatiellae bacterium]|nr:helix-turn-helix domain-containing protein [Kiritimatiellia bacterium]
MSPETTEILRPFWQQVEVRMAELHLTHDGLAKRMNVARPYVSKLLTGSVNISFGSAQKIARALNMEFRYGLQPAAPQAV